MLAAREPVFLLAFEAYNNWIIVTVRYYGAVNCVQ